MFVICFPDGTMIRDPSLQRPFDGGTSTFQTPYLDDAKLWDDPPVWVVQDMIECNLVPVGTVIMELCNKRR